MKPQFTPAQLARQERWRSEEKFSLASTIINALMFFPFLAILFPFIIPLAATAMSWVDFGLKESRRKILHDEQKTLNASKKALLVKKDALLTQLSKFDVTTDTAQLSTPSNIKFTEPIKVSRVVDGGIAKKRHINTALIKPSNVILSAIKKEMHDAPSNIEHLHKR